MVRNLVLIALLVGAGSAMAQNETAASHPQEHLDQFMKQCMDANGNRPLCQCAQNAFRNIVPAGAGRMESHEQYEGPVLQFDDEHVKALEPAIQECESKFASN